MQLLALSSDLPCPCAAAGLPLASSLARGSGGSSAAAIALAFASSGAGIDSFFYTMGNGGWTMAIARMAIVASLAWIAAVAASAFADKTRIGDGHYDDAEKTTCCSGSRKESACDDQPDESNLIVRSLDALVDVLPSIALGMCITAAHAAWYAPVATTQEAAYSSPAHRLQIILISMPLQMCEHAVVHLCKSLSAAGSTVGTVFAFLVVAPSTNVGLASLIARTCGAVASAASLAAVAIAALAASYAIDAHPPTSASLAFASSSASKVAPRSCSQGGSRTPRQLPSLPWSRSLRRGSSFFQRCKGLNIMALRKKSASEAMKCCS